MHPIDVLNLYREKELMTLGIFRRDPIYETCPMNGPLCCLSCGYPKRRVFHRLSDLHQHITKSH